MRSKLNIEFMSMCILQRPSLFSKRFLNDANIHASLNNKIIRFCRVWRCES